MCEARLNEDGLNEDGFVKAIEDGFVKVKKIDMMLFPHAETPNMYPLVPHLRLRP